MPESEKELVPAFSKESADPIKNLPFPRNMLMMQFNIFGIFVCFHFQLPEYPWHLFAFSEETHNFFLQKMQQCFSAVWNFMAFAKTGHFQF